MEGVWLMQGEAVMLISVGQEMCLKCCPSLLTLACSSEPPEESGGVSAGLCCVGRFSRRVLVPWIKMRAGRHCRGVAQW